MSTPDFQTAKPLAGRQIVVGVCGGIAAYKVAELVSKLVQAGSGVDVAMTEAATRFVTPLTFQALSGRPVHSSSWQLQDSSDPQHISLTERADLMVVAPATADLLGKVAHGLADDLLSLMITAAACPVIFAPSMNNRMWNNPLIQKNVRTLTEAGYRMIGPDAGWLACRNVGSGRLADPAAILSAVTDILGARVSEPLPNSI